MPALDEGEIALARFECASAVDLLDATTLAAGALGMAAMKARKTARLSTLPERVDSMNKAEREDKVRERVGFLSSDRR